MTAKIKDGLLNKITELAYTLSEFILAFLQHLQGIYNKVVRLLKKDSGFEQQLHWLIVILKKSNTRLKIDFQSALEIYHKGVFN